MKKIMMLIILIIIVMSSCTSEDFALWEKVQKESKERGRTCGYTKDDKFVCWNTK